MGPADALSRKGKVDTSDDNREMVLLKGDAQYHHIKAINSTLAEKIILSSSLDPIVTKALAAMNDEAGEPWLPRINKENWVFEQGSLFFKNQLYIPEGAQHQLVTNVHKSLARGHGGFFQTLHLLQKDYWWPGMLTFLRKFIAGCTLQ